jgi:hypothetical protein
MPQLAKLFWRQFQTFAEWPGQIALIDKPGQMSRAVALAKDEAAEECGGGQESFTEGHEEHSAAEPQPKVGRTPWALLAFPYSLSALTGSTRVARTAGSRHANSVAMVSTSALVPRVIESVGETLYSAL